MYIHRLLETKLIIYLDLQGGGALMRAASAISFAFRVPHLRAKKPVGWFLGVIRFHAESQIRGIVVLDDRKNIKEDRTRITEVGVADESRVYASSIYCID